MLEPAERRFLRKVLLEDKTVFDEDTVLRFSRDVACATQFVHQGGYHHRNLGSPRVILTENFTAKVRFYIWKKRQGYKERSDCGRVLQLRL